MSLKRYQLYCQVQFSYFLLFTDIILKTVSSLERERISIKYVLTFLRTNDFPFFLLHLRPSSKVATPEESIKLTWERSIITSLMLSFQAKNSLSLKSGETYTSISP